MSTLMTPEALRGDLPPHTYIEWTGTLDEPSVVAFGIHEGRIAVEANTPFYILPSGLAAPVTPANPETPVPQAEEPRQLLSGEIVALVMGALGMTSRGTGDALYKSEDTILGYRKSAYKALGVTGRHALDLSIGQCLRAGIFIIEELVELTQVSPLAYLVPQPAANTPRASIIGVKGEPLRLSQVKDRLSRLGNAAGLSTGSLSLYGYLSGSLPWQIP